MNELIDENKDENGKIIFRFSREPITKKEKDLFEPNSESYAMKELENLKIRALARLFEIEYDDPNFWRSLAMKLAQLRYPESKRLGRKLKWTNELRLLLYQEVERNLVKGERTKGISKACNDLSKKEPWKNLLAEDADKSKALRAQYYVALKVINDASS
jgi:hypothetical protein